MIASDISEAMQTEAAQRAAAAGVAERTTFRVKNLLERPPTSGGSAPGS